MKAARYHPDARDELRAAVRFGEQEREGRGASLEAAVTRVLRRIRRFEQSAPRWPRLEGTLEIHSARVKHHPYLVVYAVLSEQLVILAIAHTSQRPGYWSARVVDPIR